MHLDPVFLSRLQFALTIMFHYIFPPLSIGLGFLLVLMEGRYLASGDERYRAMARFWTGIFAVNFALGVATGVVMEFEFGTNWATYSRFVGDVFGSVLAAEGVFAFFLESGFLAVLVFGWNKVGRRMHFFSTLMVALGAVFSAVWIVVANSWQQTPAGFHIVGKGAAARAEITDYWAMVFNPSSMDRLVHVLIGSYILGAFFVMSVAAWYLLRRRHEDFARRTLFLGLLVATVFSLAAPISGHFQARKVAHTQPAKLAAFEGHFHTGTGGTPLHLWGLVDVERERVTHAVTIPGLLSWLVYENASVPVAGLDQVSEADRPPVAIPFYTYHLMVILGGGFVGLCFLGWLLYFRGALYRTRWFLWILVVAVLGPFATNEAGWTAAEVGRQPWAVYGLLRTKDAVSRAVPGEQILASIVMFGVVYFLLFLVWVFVLNHKIQTGPPEPSAEAERGGLLGTAGRLVGHTGSLTEAGGGGKAAPEAEG